MYLESYIPDVDLPDRVSTQEDRIAPECDTSSKIARLAAHYAGVHAEIVMGTSADDAASLMARGALAECLRLQADLMNKSEALQFAKATKMLSIILGDSARPNYIPVQDAQALELENTGQNHYI